MKNLLLSAIILLSITVCKGQANNGVDSLKTVSKDTVSGKHNVQASAATDTSSTAATTELKNTADSVTLMNNNSYQQAHPEILYVNKAKKFTPSFWISMLFFLGIGLLLLFKTGLCKDLSYEPQTNVLRPAGERPYSYARVQLFWWTIIILICFTSFFFYTGALVAFNSTIVLLLGGGLAVSMFGTVIDNTQIEQNGSAVPTRHQDIDTTEGLLTDILSDEGGISIHRFQAVVFNVIFGLAFIHSFYENVLGGIYPFIEFEPWQLTVLGISAAGYLGFKTNENSKATSLQRKYRAVAKAMPSAANIIEPDNLPPEEQAAAGTKPQPKFETTAFNAMKNNLLQTKIKVVPEKPGD